MLQKSCRMALCKPVGSFARVGLLASQGMVAIAAVHAGPRLAPFGSREAQAGSRGRGRLQGEP